VEPDQRVARRPSAWVRLRGLLPWLVAAAILAFLVGSVDRQALLHAFRTGPWEKLLALVPVVVLSILAADVFAIQVSCRVTGIECPYGGLFVARGATYLLGLISAAVGQGGMGIYLHKSGVTPLRAAGTVLFLFVTQGGTLILIAGTGAAFLTRAGGQGPLGLPLLAALAAAFALSLLVIAWKPAFLARFQLLAPFFHAGVRGFLIAVLARLPHVLCLASGLWLGLRLWGVPVPLAQGAVRLSGVLLISAMPVAPAGLGTTELALVKLIGPYVPLATAAARASNVLAFSLLYHLFAIGVQVIVGLACLTLVSRGAARPGRLLS
jgi:uncharacterized membrane protein YbhN (UPF0104 family)